MSTPLPRDVAEELRHELNARVHEVASRAERLRSEAVPDSPHAGQCDRISAAAGAALARIDAAFSPAHPTTAEDVAKLVTGLAEPQASMLAASTALLWGGRGGRFTAEAARLAEAARGLTAIPHPNSTAWWHPADAAARPTRGAASAPDTAAAAALQAGGARILIVDDFGDSRVLLAHRLASEGYLADAVASGAEALVRLATGGFDLVLLDVLMPGMDGFQLLERIKADPETRRIPVIMISALDDLSSVVRCIEHGAEDYLAKGCDPVLLRARIDASLERKRWHDREADYLRQVGAIADAAAAVEEGTYASGALAGIAARDDALGLLARVFDAMAAGIRAREARLREQLRELRADVSFATRASEAAHQASAQGTGELPVGMILAGRYEILGVVGRGGMGVVYRVRDRELGEDVALKMIHRGLLADNPVLAELFKSEIRLARRISHRNVVRTHDLGEADGASFVTMEYVRGVTVRELLTSRGKLGTASTLAVARQLAEALAVAHAAGVIHRDVKPENALIDADGALKVMDFGIARLAAGSISRSQQALIVGTPTYMAPEQLVGDEIDPRADLYAVGVVMYECLSGVLPFEATSLVALIGKVITTEPVPLAARVADVPPALSALVMRLLAKAPGERPSGAAAVLEQLAELG